MVKAQQLSRRKGWQSQNLALYFLHQFAFIAEPSHIADDVGVDYYCTLFDIQDKNYLIPRSAFSIQVKSDKSDIELAKSKVDYFNDLEMPFFIGVVNKAKWKMDVYSGEYFQHFAPLLGNPLDPRSKRYRGQASKVLLRPVMSQPKPGKHWILEGTNYVLLFPYLGSVSITNEEIDIQTISAAMKERCALMLRNISSRKAQSYVLELHEPKAWQMYVGPDSALSFRENFDRRFAEAFANIDWLYQSKSDHFSIDEFLKFEQAYKALKNPPRAILSAGYSMTNQAYLKLRKELESAGLLEEENDH